MNSNIVTVGKKIRQIREAVGLSRPKFADLLGVPPTTLKNYELGYREVGGAFLVALAHHPELHKFTLWLLADKKVAAENMKELKADPLGAEISAMFNGLEEEGTEKETRKLSGMKSLQKTGLKAVKSSP